MPMNIRTNPVKELVRAGKPAFGTWITLCPHPRVVKMFAASGFDFVIIEMEHTDFNMQTVGMLAMLAREAGLVPFVRPPGTMKPHDLTRPLDAGAQGLLLPSVDTPEQMEAIVKATKYHPLGHRPMNLKGPHTDYVVGDPDAVSAHVNAHTMLVAMIETRTAIDNIDALCDVEGLDAVFIGPDDLSQDLGVPGRMGHPALAEAIEEVFAACRKKGMAFGISSHNPQMVAQRVQEGATWLPYSNDAAMVFNAAQAIVPELMKIGGRAK